MSDDDLPDFLRDDVEEEIVKENVAHTASSSAPTKATSASLETKSDSIVEVPKYSTTEEKEINQPHATSSTIGDPSNSKPTDDTITSSPPRGDSHQVDTATPGDPDMEKPTNPSKKPPTDGGEKQNGDNKQTRASGIDDEDTNVRSDAPSGGDAKAVHLTLREENEIRIAAMTSEIYAHALGVREKHMQAAARQQRSLKHRSLVPMSHTPTPSLQQASPVRQIPANTSQNTSQNINNGRSVSRESRQSSNSKRIKCYERPPISALSMRSDASPLPAPKYDYLSPQQLIRHDQQRAADRLTAKKERERNERARLKNLAIARQREANAKIERYADELSLVESAHERPPRDLPPIHSLASTLGRTPSERNNYWVPSGQKAGRGSTHVRNGRPRDRWNATFDEGTFEQRTQEKQRAREKQEHDEKWAHIRSIQQRRSDSVKQTEARKRAHQAFLNAQHDLESAAARADEAMVEAQRQAMISENRLLERRRRNEIRKYKEQHQQDVLREALAMRLQSIEASVEQTSYDDRRREEDRQAGERQRMAYIHALENERRKAAARQAAEDNLQCEIIARTIAYNDQKEAERAAVRREKLECISRMIADKNANLDKERLKQHIKQSETDYMYEVLLRRRRQRISDREEHPDADGYQSSGRSNRRETSASRKSHDHGDEHKTSMLLLEDRYTAKQSPAAHGEGPMPIDRSIDAMIAGADRRESRLERYARKSAH